MHEAVAHITYEWDPDAHGLAFRLPFEPAWSDQQNATLPHELRGVFHHCMAKWGMGLLKLNAVLPIFGIEFMLNRYGSILWNCQPLVGHLRYTIPCTSHFGWLHPGCLKELACGGVRWC